MIYDFTPFLGVDGLWLTYRRTGSDASLGQEANTSTKGGMVGNRAGTGLSASAKQKLQKLELQQKSVKLCAKWESCQDMNYYSVCLFVVSVLVFVVTRDCCC